ncbi:hypothetical protein CCACVL1_07830 [Corchorus capsularis]|uniref:Bifunctional inhibitor/plant lipid transfer protein/seed storage helical domain-containing protein n=1 Tax=Corchorus capsularis TaxID=210143 RepID=A0A1R3J3M4_COCAP|nr:hypothetical protein CCACVL1_07830 [Corchorus capsularis]
MSLPIDDEKAWVGLRRWEELDGNILKNIFKRVPSSDLILKVRGVCRPWHLACWDTLFWSDPKTLDFSSFCSAFGFGRKKHEILVDISKVYVRHRMEKFKRFLTRIMELGDHGNDAYGNPLDRWSKSIKKIVIPIQLADILTDDHLVLIAERTPAVETLSLLATIKITVAGFARATSYWKNISHLAVGFCHLKCPYVEMIEQIGKSYPQLTTMEFCSRAPTSFRVDMPIAQAIARGLPKLTTLRFEIVSLYKQAVVFIYNNCPELKVIHCPSVSTNDNSRQTSENIQNKGLNRACEKFLTKSCRRIQMVTNTIKGTTSSCRRRLRSCCEELEQIEVQRRCQEIRRFVREKLEEEELRGRERKEMLQKAKNLPALCYMGIGRCDIRPFFLGLD